MNSQSSRNHTDMSSHKAYNMKHNRFNMLKTGTGLIWPHKKQQTQLNKRKSAQNQLRNSLPTKNTDSPQKQFSGPKQHCLKQKMKKK